MIRFKIRGIGKGGEVSIHSNDAEELSSFEASDDAFSRLFIGWLDGVMGPHGHFLETDKLRANDLDFALANTGIKYELVEGELSDYVQPPEGAVN